MQPTCFFFYHSQLTQNLFNNLAQLKITSPFAGVNGLSFYGLQVAFGKRYICWFMYKPGQGLHHLLIMTTCKTCIMGTL